MNYAKSKLYNNKYKYDLTNDKENNMKEILIHKTERCEKYLRENGEIKTIFSSDRITYNNGILKKGDRFETKANLYRTKNNYEFRDVSKLMGELFIQNPENLPHIIHLNGNTLDNRKENLMWGSHLEVKDINREKFSGENGSSNKRTILILDEEKFEFINIKSAIEFLSTKEIKANRDWWSRKPVPKRLKNRLQIEAI